MSKTVWIKNCAEGFIQTEGFIESASTLTISGNTKISSDTSGNTNPVADFGDDVYIGKDVNELILTNDPKTALPTPTPTPTQENPDGPSHWEQAKDLYNNFDSNKAHNLYKNVVSSFKNSIDNTNGSIAGTIASAVYENTESPEAKKDISVLSSQIAKWMSIAMSYIVLLNWWYLLAYTHFVFDFRRLIWSSIYWPMAPPLNAIQFINYYLVYFRMDKNSKTQELMRTWIWDNRPIWFSVLHALILTMLVYSPITDGMNSVMISDGIFYYIILALSVYFFFNLFIKEKWYEKFMYSGTIGYLILLALTIISFLCMFLFIKFACPLFLCYILCLSYYTIVLYSKLWPPSIISACYQIFQELKEAPVYEKSDIPGKIGNFVFQNFHNIYLLSIVIGIFIANIVGLMSLSHTSLIAIGIIANVTLLLLFGFSSILELLPVFITFIDTSDLDVIPKQPNYT